MRYKNYIGIILSILGVCFLLFVGMLYPKTSISNAFLYQGITLLFSAILIIVVRFIFGRFQYFSIGQIGAKAAPVKLFGITEKDTWKTFGITLWAAISIGTLVFMLIGVFQKSVPISMAAVMVAVALSIPLSLLNAFNEEVITRWLIVETLKESALFRYAPWVSAVVFGVPHYFGTPGGIVGACMAGFMGWFLARSIQDTKGMFWAFFIHFTQDVIIFTVLLFQLL